MRLQRPLLQIPEPAARMAIPTGLPNPSPMPARRSLPEPITSPIPQRKQKNECDVEESGESDPSYLRGEVESVTCLAQLSQCLAAVFTWIPKL